MDLIILDSNLNNSISLNESTWLSAVASVKNSYLTILLNLTHHFLLLTINGFTEKERNILIQNKLRTENIKLQLLKIKKCPKLGLINTTVKLLNNRVL